MQGEGIIEELINIWEWRADNVKIENVDKFTGKLIYFIIIGIFMIEFSAGLAIAHLEAVHECQASACVIERHNTK